MSTHMPEDDEFQPNNKGPMILYYGKLPRAEDGWVPTLDSTPFQMNGHIFV
eukprot:COSAG01_NODE_64303_length_277_cov_0.573034_1_plen_50_part_01